MRHCQTFGNAYNIGMGVKESEWSLLNVIGVNQAVSIGNRLLDQRQDYSKYKFISSPFNRTIHTLKIILDLLGLKEAKIELDPALSSKNKGAFEGITKDEIKKLYPEEDAKKQKDSWNYTPPECGESMENMYQRLLDFVKKHKGDENLIVVAHESGCRVLQYILEGKSRDEIKESNFDQSQDYFVSWDNNKIEVL
jgi:broad specificity phosphatase PhoE